MFVDGLFNADPHSGNILVHVDPSGHIRPVLLDFGMVTTINHRIYHETNRDEKVFVLIAAYIYLCAGLTKRLEPRMKEALSRMLYSAYAR